MTYDDVIGAQRKCDVEEALPNNTKEVASVRKPAADERKTLRIQELEHGRRDIEAL
jgi:hypothetical protein